MKTGALWLMRVFFREGRKSHHGQCREYERLDKADKKLQTQKWNGGYVRYEEGNYDQKDFAGKNISEQSERKRKDFGEFADDFQKTGKSGNRTFKI